MAVDLSLIFRGITSVISIFSSDSLDKVLVGEKITKRRELRETSLQPILQKASEDVAEIIEPMGSAEIDQICLFLTSTEAEAIVRQIYAVSIRRSKEQNIEQIEQEFLKAFSL